MYCIVSSAYVKVNRKNEKVAMALARNCETVQDRQQFNLGWLQQLNSARPPQRLPVLLRSDERPRWLARCRLVVSDTGNGAASAQRRFISSYLGRIRYPSPRKFAGTHLNSRSDFWIIFRVSCQNAALIVFKNISTISLNAKLTLDRIPRNTN